MRLVKTLTGNINHEELIKEKHDDNIFVIKLRYAAQEDDKCINKCEFTYYGTDDDKNFIKGFDVYNKNCKDKILETPLANLEDSQRIIAFRYYHDDLEYDDDEDDEDDDDDDDDSDYDSIDNIQHSWVYFSQTCKMSIEGDSYFFKIIIDSVDIYVKD